MSYFNPDNLEKLKLYLDMRELSGNLSIPLSFIETRMDWEWEGRWLIKRDDVTLEYIEKTAWELTNAYNQGSDINLIGKFWEYYLIIRQTRDLDFIFDGKFDFWFRTKGTLEEIFLFFRNTNEIIQIVEKYYKFNPSFNWDEIVYLVSQYCEAEEFCDFVRKYSHMGFDPVCIYIDLTSFSLDEIEEKLLDFNNWKTVSLNPNLTLPFILKYENSKIWNWISLFNEGKIDEKILETKIILPGEKVNFSPLSNKGWKSINARKLTLEFIEKYSDKKLNWSEVSEHPLLNYDFVKKYIGKGWEWSLLLTTKIIPLCEISKDSEIMKIMYRCVGTTDTWYFISQRDDLTPEFMKENNESLDFELLSGGSWLTLEFIIDHILWDWDWSIISKREDLFKECIQLKKSALKKGGGEEEM